MSVKKSSKFWQCVIFVLVMRQLFRNMRKSLLLVIVCCMSQYMVASDFFSKKGNSNSFNHLDLSLTVGSTGLGVDLATPIYSDVVQFRAGYAFMPGFRQTMTFGVDNYTKDGTIVSSKKQQISELMKKFTGYNIDYEVDMVGVPTYHNLNVMVDVFPFRNKKWHFTAGFYVGPSRIAKAYNTTEDMPTLLAVGVYNNLYDFFVEEKYIDEPLYGEYYLDWEVGDMMRDKMGEYGRMGIYLGDMADGLYMMLPDADGMVKCTVQTNNFKPYLGFGFGDPVGSSGKKYNLSFDCGIMVWGGSPKVITHDGTDLVYQVDNVRGKVGDCVDFISAFKVFPVLNLRITRRLF